MGLFVGREWCCFWGALWAFPEVLPAAPVSSWCSLEECAAAVSSLLKRAHSGEAVTFIGKVNMGVLCTHKFYSGACWDIFNESHVSSDGPSEWVPSWADLCLAKDACMPQCTSKCHYGIAWSSGKLGVFLHSFFPSIGLQSDPVQMDFLVCRRSCVALVQMLLGARGRVVLDPCWPTHGLEQQRHISFNIFL